MRKIALLSAWLAACPASAEQPAQKEAVSQVVREVALERDHFGRPLNARLHAPAATRAIENAWKKDAAEENLKAWTEVLVKCQQATNPAWTTALMRSEAQQAHCYRY